MSQKTLLTALSAERTRNNLSLLWDLYIYPLLNGPLSILDNMILDNEPLMTFLADEKNLELFRFYVNNGYLVLWHREFYYEQYKVRALEDVLKCWLMKSGKQVNDVDFAILQTIDKGRPNDELRKMIAGFGNTPPAERLTAFYGFIEKYYSHYQSYVRTISDIFAHSESHWSSDTYSLPPSNIGQRILHSFGVENPEKFLHKCHVAKTTIPNQLIYDRSDLRKDAGVDLDSIYKMNDLLNKHDPLKQFFEYLKENPSTNITQFQECTSVMQPINGINLHELITNIYDCGVPERNGGNVLLERNRPLIQDPEYDLKLFDKLRNRIFDMKENNLFPNLSQQGIDYDKSSEQKLMDISDLLLESKLEKELKLARIAISFIELPIKIVAGIELPAGLKSYMEKLNLSLELFGSLKKSPYEPIARKVKFRLYKNMRMSSIIMLNMRADFYRYGNYKILGEEKIEY